jgi:hypothetical protein
LLGAGSHIFWDSFTHNHAYFVRTLPFYKGSYVPYEGVRYPLWYALQHISTAVGLTIMAAYLLAMKPQSIRMRSIPRAGYWLVLILITAAITWIRFEIVPLDANIGNLIVTIISGVVIALVCCGWINFKNTFVPQQGLNG